MSWPARLPTVARTDWFRVLMDLKQAGLSLGTIAMFIESHKATVIGWKNHDAEPSHMHGERVIMLWERATGRPRSEVPRVRDLTAIKPGEPPPLRAPHRCPMCGACGQLSLL